MEEKTFFKGDWKAIEKLGEGSFGTVYKAEKSQYGVKSYSAIKQIMIPQTEKEYSKLRSEGLTQNDIEKSYDNQVKKWIEEIKFLEQFKENNNIVSIEDFEVIERKDKIGRIINIRMELLQNVDSYFLDNVATDKDILKMALDILNALEECEEKNVVHRDIKPDNIFVNNKGTYKLGDFGEAKNIEKTVSNMSKKGTENYMAPEIYKGEKGSKTVDTYSLGIMLYKYFNNNRLPFLPDYPNDIKYEDREEAIYKRMFGEKMKVPCKASNKISEIILKACRYNPEDRYESATEFKNEVIEEYRKIQEPMKLFDFQEENNGSFGKTCGFENNSNVKINNDKTDGFESESYQIDFDKTSGVFEDNKNIEKDFNKTSGIFNNTLNNKDVLEYPYYKTKEQFNYNPNLKDEQSQNKGKFEVEKNIKNCNKVTSLPVGVETYGGVFTRIFDKNIKLPVKKSLTFSTAKDGQKTVEVHVLQGENVMSAQNESLGKFSFTNIPASPRGVPQLELIFDIDINGIVHILLKDIATGNEQKFTSTIPIKTKIQSNNDYIDEINIFIKDKNFSKQIFNGYNINEVDNFLKEISLEIEQLKLENNLNFENKLLKIKNKIYEKNFHKMFNGYTIIEIDNFLDKIIEKLNFFENI